MLRLLIISLLRFLSELTSLLFTFSYVNLQCSRHFRSRKTELSKLAWTFLSDVTLTTKSQSKRPGTAHARYTLAVLSCKLQTSERHCWVTKKLFGWSPIASKESVFCSWRNKVHVCIFTAVQHKSFTAEPKNSDIVIPGRGFGRSLGLILTPKNEWIQNNLLIVYTGIEKIENTMYGEDDWFIELALLITAKNDRKKVTVGNEIFSEPGFFGLGKGSVTGRCPGRGGSLGRIRGRILGRGLGLTGAVE